MTRSIPPAETIRRVAALMERIGVTRVAEITRLDRIGIPNYISVRPRDLGPGISYYNGKGLTRAAAKAGAMMEALERYSGERWEGGEPEVATFTEIGRRAAAVDPGELIVPAIRPYQRSLRLEWVPGTNLLNGEPTYVPLNAVLCPYEPRRGQALFYASTNGLASGNTIEEALCHALCEVIERDALAISLATLELAPAVDAVLSEARHPSSRCGAGRDFQLIDPKTLPLHLLPLVGRFRKAGVRVYLRDITSTAGIPTIDCTVVEDAMGSQLVHGGCGTHPDARVAAARALTEAAQSRVACIQGGREDLPEIVRPRDRFDADEIYGCGGIKPFSAIQSFESSSVRNDIELLLQRLAADGFEQVIAIDMTKRALRVPVVRVVVPRAEAWTVFHLHTGRGVFGKRVAQQLTRGAA